MTGTRAEHRRGHTLPELMIVLTILALLGVLALPRMAHVLASSRLDATVEAVRDDLAFAKARAISTGMRQQVLVDPETRELVVLPYRMAEMASQTSTTVDPNAAAPPSLRDNLPEQVQVVEWSVSAIGGEQSTAGGAVQTGTPIVFYPEGYGDAARVVLEDSSGSRRGLLVDSFTGEIREMTPEELENR
jgi:prepilin-type N-terminal cleavage/methylation domain-containing protein